MLIPELAVKIPVYLIILIASIFPLICIIVLTVRSSQNQVMSGKKTFLAVSAIIISAAWIFIFPLQISEYYEFPRTVWIVKEDGSEIRKESYFLTGTADYKFSNGAEARIKNKEFHIVINDTKRMLMVLPVHYRLSYGDSGYSSGTENVYIVPANTVTYAGSLESRSEKLSDELTLSRMQSEKENQNNDQSDLDKLLKRRMGNSSYKKLQKELLSVEKILNPAADQIFKIRYFGDGNEAPKDYEIIKMGIDPNPGGYWLCDISTFNKNSAETK